MRRNLGLSAIGLGALLSMLAPLMMFWVAPSQMVIPKDLVSVTRAEAKDATYLSLADISDGKTVDEAVHKGRTMVATRTVRADRTENTPNTRVLDVALVISDPDLPGTGAQQLITASIDRVAMDPHTSEAINCCDEGIAENSDRKVQPVKHEGIEYKFPFGAEKKDYNYFDLSLRRATPIKFVGTEDLKGIKANVYEQKVEPTSISVNSVPGAWFNLSDENVSAERMYSVVRRVHVEPVTGQIIRGEEDQVSYLQEKTSGKRITTTDAQFIWTEETQDVAAESAKSAAAKIKVFTRILPIVLLLAGLGLIGLGVFLVRREDTGGDSDSGTRGRGNDDSPIFGKRGRSSRQPEYV